MRLCFSLTLVILMTLKMQVVRMRVFHKAVLIIAGRGV